MEAGPLSLSYLSLLAVFHISDGGYFGEDYGDIINNLDRESGEKPKRCSAIVGPGCASGQEERALWMRHRLLSLLVVHSYLHSYFKKNIVTVPILHSTRTMRVLSKIYLRFCFIKLFR